MKQLKQRLTYRLAALAALVSSVVLGAGFMTASASALTLPPTHLQFHATGIPTSFTSTISPTLPLPGQGFILDENLVDTNNTVIGTNHVDCRIVTLTSPTSVQFGCLANFTLSDGSMNAVATFSASQTSTQPNYDAIVVSGTGRYTATTGVIHVSDSGPGNPEGYDVDVYVF
jgi:hypothetical protein